MSLWKNGAFVDDAWTFAGPAGEIAGNGAVAVSLTRWRAEREALTARPGPLGLVIEPSEHWEDVLPDLGRFAMIALTIPKYADGRAFSIARLLRERDHYSGEIRAVGTFIIDQIPLMQRIGIDAFAVTEEAAISGLRRGDWPEVPNYLQPVNQAAEVPAGARPWARRRAEPPRGAH